MKYPYCNEADAKVIGSHLTDDNSPIRRRHQYERCGKRFTTYEGLEAMPSVIIKKDNSRETYDRSKIEAGITHSCHKRSVSPQQINSMIDEIEDQIFNMKEKEVPTSTIGELAMGKLKDLDEVAYMCFISICREFKGMNTLIDEIGKLLKKQNYQNRLEGTLISMLEMLYPRHYEVSTYVILSDYYHAQGMQGVIFGIDNTLVSRDALADGQAVELFERLRAMGMKTCLLSNNKESRVKPFADFMGSYYIRKAGKSGIEGHEKTVELMGTDREHTLFMGNQLSTNMYDTNRAGLYSILVRSMNPGEEI